MGSQVRQKDQDEGVEIVNISKYIKKLCSPSCPWLLLLLSFPLNPPREFRDRSVKTHLFSTQTFSLFSASFLLFFSSKMTADTNAGGSDAPKQEAIIRTTEEDTSKPQDLPSDGKNEDASKSTTETPKEETESKPDVAAGSVTESHSLYAKYDKEGNRSWSVKLPDHVEDAAENAETSKYALIVRRCTSHSLPSL